MADVVSTGVWHSLPGLPGDGAATRCESVNVFPVRLFVLFSYDDVHSVTWSLINSTITSADNRISAGRYA